MEFLCHWVPNLYASIWVKGRQAIEHNLPFSCKKITPYVLGNIVYVKDVMDCDPKHRCWSFADKKCLVQLDFGHMRVGEEWSHVFWITEEVSAELCWKDLTEARGTDWS